MPKKLDIPNFFEGPPLFMPEAPQPKPSSMPPRRTLHLTGNRQAATLGVLAGVRRTPTKQDSIMQVLQTMR
jgi:hypothetical protein